MWHAANMSFAVCPLLTQGAVDLLQSHGSESQKRTYLPRLISGRWTGTMNLTEPQAGTDVGAITTRAVRDGERYRITGQKIFITYGDHDFSENIIHMVLARVPGAPPGIKGISLFIVPKFLPGPEGSPGRRNDLRCVSLERKLGIHASPTAVMAYGDNEGAIGELVGAENHGIEYMFTMMNNARLAIGIQGVAIAERAYQQARDHARTRRQGRGVDGADAASVPIIRHPDVRRMLMTMRAQIAATRALIYLAAATIDRAKHDPDKAERDRQQSLADLLIPVAKAWCTDTGCAVASTAIQVHGGLGYIEETGVAQHFRDARIAPIYEGTNGIQANDLVGRKLMRDGGATARAFITEMQRTCEEFPPHDGADGRLRRSLDEGIAALARTTDRLVAAWRDDKAKVLAGASPYLSLFGTVTGGWLLTRAARAAARRLGEGDRNTDVLEPALALARFYADNLLPQAAGLAAAACDGAASVLELPEEWL
jgi:alkylation response protein AidB-like acyl-CoA dehydrogenase